MQTVIDIRRQIYTPGMEIMCHFRPALGTCKTDMQQDTLSPFTTMVPASLESAFFCQVMQWTNSTHSTRYILPVQEHQKKHQRWQVEFPRTVSASAHFHVLWSVSIWLSSVSRANFGRCVGDWLCTRSPFMVYISTWRFLGGSGHFVVQTKFGRHNTSWRTVLMRTQETKGVNFA